MFSSITTSASICGTLTWNDENLAKYIADPKGFVAGNKMAFAGVKKEEDLKNLVAYLLEAAK